jgi:DnaJ-class molecular chaperone
MADKNCPKCHGKGFVDKDPDKNGSSHTCWDCLNKGKMDQHSTDLKDSDIKI